MVRRSREGARPRRRPSVAQEAAPAKAKRFSDPINRSEGENTMDGIHDMGGMQGFGRVPVAEKEPIFHAPWEGRTFGMMRLLLGGGLTNIDAFRHAIERLDPAVYLTAGYFGRWLAALET